MHVEPGFLLVTKSIQVFSPFSVMLKNANSFYIVDL